MRTPKNPLDHAGTAKMPRRFKSGPKKSVANPAIQVPDSNRSATSAGPEAPTTPESRDVPITETDFAELSDGTLLELVQDPTDPGQRSFAVWRNGEICFLNRLEQDGRVFVPPSENSEILDHIRLPRGASSYKSAQEILSGLESLISQGIGVEEKYVPVLANFVLSTWFVDGFLVAPYLSVVGLPQSGKTTLLRLLNLVCRRSLLVADISSASFYWVCAKFMATILIDETGTAGNNRELRHMLRSGTTHDVLAIRKDVGLHSYGAKVVSWLEPPDDSALNSRCIQIPMFESKRANLLAIGDPKIQQLADSLQAQLLRFRLDNFKKVISVPVPGDEDLRPRARDILRALTAAHPRDNQRSQILLNFFKTGQILPAEPLSYEQNVVLQLLFSLVHTTADEYSLIYIAQATEALNECLKAAGERFRLRPRKVGALFSSLGLSDRKRTNAGWTLQLTLRDAERIHQLVACYGIDGFEGLVMRMDGACCKLCRDAGLDKVGPDLPPGVPESANQEIFMRIGRDLAKASKDRRKRYTN
jgi:hypothetical protein